MVGRQTIGILLEFFCVFGIDDINCGSLVTLVVVFGFLFQDFGRWSMDRDPLDRDAPGQRPPLYGNVRAVRILLECILDHYEARTVSKGWLASTGNLSCIWNDS